MAMNGNHWDGWGITQIGPLHIKNGTQNQDSFAIKKFEWGIVGVVCDGLGSKRYSHIGSKGLVDAIIKVSQIFDFQKSKIEQFELLVKSIWNENIYPYSENDCSTTLLCAIIKHDRVYVGRVGDGAIGILGDKNILVEENKDTFSTYTTPFGREERILWQTFDVKDTKSISLCSDGISEDVKKNNLLNFFKEYVLEYKNQKKRKRKKNIKKWLKNWPVKGHSDDKTIVSLVKMDKNEKNRSI